MKIMVFGAGSLGSVIGALLSRFHEVCLITRGEHLKEIRKNGLRLEGLLDETFKLQSYDAPRKDSSFDLVIVTVKSYDTEIAARTIEQSFSGRPLVLTIQNGIGNAEKIASVLGKQNVALGVTSMAAHRSRPGVVKYVCQDEMILGSLSRLSEAVIRSEEALSVANISARRTENIEGVIWSKAIVNAAINPLTAIHRCKNGVIAQDNALREQALKICEEGAQVASAKRISLDPHDVARYMMSVATKTAMNKSSMLMDVEFGRRTEIEAICGEILRAGKEVGVETPTISKLYSEIKAIEPK